MLASNGQRAVVTFDHRGLGESACPLLPSESPCTVANLAEDARDVLGAATGSGTPSLAAYHAMGISMGGMVAQNLALDAARAPGGGASAASVASLVLGCTTHGGREATAPPREFLELCTAWAALGDEGCDEAARRDFALQFIAFSIPSDLTSRPGGKALHKKIVSQGVEEGWYFPILGLS